MLRNAARARFTPTPGVATPLSHATPSPAVARRRRRPRRPPVSFSIYLRRAVPPGFFTSTRLRRPATRASRRASASLCGERGARHRGVIRHRREKEDAEGRKAET
ncbi:hypothetical protein CAJAP_06566 [Camponotus japonicus]